MGRQYVDRVGRKRQIWETMEAIGRSLTVHEIARFVHLEPSTYLRGILKEMVNDETVQFYEVQHRPNRVKRLYVLHAQYTAPMHQEHLI